MNRGMLWFDNDPRKSLANKIAEVAQYYRRKYGSLPTLCLVNPSVLIDKTTGEIVQITVRPYRAVLPGHLWIGFADAGAA